MDNKKAELQKITSFVPLVAALAFAFLQVTKARQSAIGCAKVCFQKFILMDSEVF